MAIASVYLRTTIRIQVMQTEFVQDPPSRAPEPPIRALARQLQLRLRYARLKVEHGWQRQTINEVENLYFHHHHLRSAPSKPVETRSQSSGVACPDNQASSEKSQKILSSQSVFSSRQQPNEILVLRPPVGQPEQLLSSGDTDVHMRTEGGTTDATPDVAHAILTGSEVPAVENDLPPQIYELMEIHETGSEVVLPTSERSASSGIADSGLANRVDQDMGYPTTDDNSQTEGRGRNDSFAQNAPPVPAGAALGLARASGSTSSNAQMRQLAVTQRMNTTTSSNPGRPAMLTYDSFWSSRSLSSPTYNSPCLDGTSKLGSC